jgi:hypothetical protein
MKILAVVTAPLAVSRILKNLGLPTEAPHLHARRPPPQMELEEARVATMDLCHDPPCPDW